MKYQTLEQRMLTIEAGSENGLPFSNFRYRDCKYVIQAECSGMGWADTNRKASTFPEAKRQLKRLISDDSAWMPGDYERKARIAKNKR